MSDQRISVEAAAARLFRLAAITGKESESIRLKAAEAIGVFKAAVLRAEANRILKLPIVTDPIEGSALQGPLWYKQAFIDLANELKDTALMEDPYPRVEEYPSVCNAPGRDPESGEIAMCQLPPHDFDADHYSVEMSTATWPSGESPDPAYPILRTIAEFQIEANNSGGVDINDLVYRLERMGYTMPEVDDE